jgi:cyclopropane-fatty-acyl-phospholipid synthase
MLERLDHGHLELITPHGTTLTFGDLRQPPSAQLRILTGAPAAPSCAPAISASAKPMAPAGWTPDLAALLRLAMRNRAGWSARSKAGRLASWWYRLRHLLRANTRSGSRRNIHAHYDLGNDFYACGWTRP